MYGKPLGLVNFAAFLLAGLMCISSVSATQVIEPDGYKLDDYRSPVPGTLEEAIVINAVQARKMHQQDAVIFIDVFPSQKRPDNFGESDLWLPKQRFNIPGSAWLADTGYGVLSVELEKYFKLNLERLSNHDTAKSLVFYCNSDCWMSWNAARRAVEAGYTNVFWFPGGVDEWSAHGYELSGSNPVQKLD